MKELNKMRLAAGLVIDPSIEITERVQVNEARETPRRRSDLKQGDAKSLKAKVRGCKSACKHINAAIDALERIPATDFAGDVPRFIGELEDLLDCGGESGMEGYLEMCSSELRKTEGKEKQEKRKSDEEEEYEKLEADAEVEAMATNEDEGFGEFIKSLSDVQQEQLRVAMDVLQKLTGGGIIGEAAYETITTIMGDKLEEAMHYYGVQYKGSHEADGDKPINVSDGTSNDEQVMDTLPPTKKEGPTQMKAEEEEKVKVKDDFNTELKIPNGIKQSLRTEIDKANQESKKLDSRDKDASYFYRDLARAFSDLLGHLEKGTRYDFKQAQTFAQTLMGPMLHKIPTDVWKFLTNGGETRSLKDYMKPVDKKFAGLTSVKKSK